MISLFELYKIGIGPSSSHTFGPMIAAKRFIEALDKLDLMSKTSRIQVSVYGSLALTGKGHHTDQAILLGLSNQTPESVELDNINYIIDQIKQEKRLPYDQFDIEFDYIEDLIFYHETLEKHENGLIFCAYKQDATLLEKTYYSIGGGFVVTDEDFGQIPLSPDIPYPFSSAKQLLAECTKASLSISTLIKENECSRFNQQLYTDKMLSIWQTMQHCIERGINKEGLLPGPMKVPRRAADLYRQLKAQQKLTKDPMVILDWVNLYAFAVSEENASGGRVVTAPTNGACGIIPAVLTYYNNFIHSISDDDAARFLCTAGAIGMLFKRNASISGAEVGCQGEVGVACSMAAAGLTELMGGSPAQACIAAEIAMEHHLGLTCDPVAGQVQIPCIERNGIAAVKAINASRMALYRNSAPKVSLDKVIATMYETGKDMNAKYRETSLGGLALKVLC